jgi:ApaG protein
MKFHPQVVAAAALLLSSVETVGAFVVPLSFSSTSTSSSTASSSLVSSSSFFTAVSSSRPDSVLYVKGGDGKGSGFLGQYDDDEEDDEDEDDEDEEDEDDDDLALSGRYSGSSSSASSLSGLKLDPWDPNPLIKPRPSRYFQNEMAGSDIVNDSTATGSGSGLSFVKDEDLVQKMTASERSENLTVLRRIRKTDLPDLRMRKDHAGWVEANNEMKRRLAKDPWFAVNERLRDAIQLGEDESKIQHLNDLSTRLGGPPPGLEITGQSRPYAVHTEIYDIGISPTRATGMLDREIRNERAARGRAMMAERRKNLEAQQRQYEDDMRNPGVREDREAKERRERTMRRIMDEIEADNAKKRERAKDILGKVPETPESRTKAMEKALNEAREEVKKMRRKQLGREARGLSPDDEDDEDNEDDDDDDSASSSSSRKRAKSGADKAREAAAAEASGGRPRLPGDADVTRGEVADDQVDSSSNTVTGPLSVQVSSVYNPEQSDPAMRKHCFQYTIRITNHSPSDTIQLLGRRFEIQTVGSSMKDVVQGKGVTGRTPVLKPGEVFEYTSTAPLSVRPIGTTNIAARMRGEYRYITLQPGQESATEELQNQAAAAGTESMAELGTFHFIFPEDQRVTPFRGAETADDDDDDDDDEDDKKASTATKAKTASSPFTSSSSTAAASSSSTTSPASTLPGDRDMTSGDITVAKNDSSESVTDGVRVQVTSSYRPERSDEALGKHCFAYNIRITNESKDNRPIQLVSRRFEIQTIGSPHKDVVQGPGVTGRQPILQPGESFEYTSTAPLSVRPMSKTPVVARMQGEYHFVQLSTADGTTPISSTPLKAKLATFHFILPQAA